jgi:uncharacterized protein
LQASPPPPRVREPFAVQAFQKTRLPAGFFYALIRRLSAMRIIRAADHVTVPWKNGGGTATNIIASPEGAGFDAFHWRLSGAHVGQDGPFSLFPHVDRTMLILQGETLVLHGPDHGPVFLTTSSPPYDFPGDIPVSATLPAGPVDDLNIMVDRRRFHKTVRRCRLTLPETLNPRGTLLVYGEQGAVTAMAGPEHVVLAAKDTLVTQAAVVLAGHPGSLAVIIEIWPV